MDWILSNIAVSIWTVDLDLLARVVTFRTGRKTVKMKTWNSKRFKSGLSWALVDKDDKMSVGKWILETTHPHKHVQIPEDHLLLEKVSESKRLSCHACHQEVSGCEGIHPQGSYSGWKAWKMGRRFPVREKSGNFVVWKSGNHAPCFWYLEQMSSEVQNKDVSFSTKSTDVPQNIKKFLYFVFFPHFNISAIFRTCNFRLTGGVRFLSGNLVHQLLIEVKLSINVLLLHDAQK